MSLIIHLDGATGLTDQSGEGNDGTYVGDATTTSDAERGTVFTFDGNNDRIDVTNAITFGTSTKWSFFVRLKCSTIASSPALLSRFSSELRLQSSGNAWFIWQGTTRWESDTAALYFADGDWHSFGFAVNSRDSTASDSDVEFFFDGISDGATLTVGSAGMDSSDASSVSRFGNNAANARDYNGSLDEIRVYDHALTAADFLTLHNGDSGPAPQRRQAAQQVITGAI